MSTDLPKSIHVAKAHRRKKAVKFDREVFKVGLLLARLETPGGCLKL